MEIIFSEYIGDLKWKIKTKSNKYFIIGKTGETLERISITKLKCIRISNKFIQNKGKFFNEGILFYERKSLYPPYEIKAKGLLVSIYKYKNEEELLEILVELYNE